MDLRAFYKKIREVEAIITQPYVVVISVDTPDGGKAGVSAQVTKPVAARLVAEGRVRLASDEEAVVFHEGQAEGRREAEALAAAQRMHVTIVPQADYRQPKPRAKE